MIERLQSEVDMMKRHAKVLNAVRDEGSIGIVKLSERTDFPSHKIRYSLRVLEEEGLIEPTNKGASLTEESKDFILDANEQIDDIISDLEEMKFNK